MHYLFSEADPFNNLVIIEGEESRHASILRLKKDEKIGILNGRGRILIGIGEMVNKNTFQVKISSREERPSEAFNLHVAIAPTKQIDRFEWFLEKATELGIHTITPLYCDHGERTRINRDRLHKILIASIKQCGRSWLPNLHEPVYLDEFLNKKKPENTYLAHAGGQDISEMKPAFNMSSLCICIGPEGDFSERELSLADQLKIPKISFSHYRLRTETAALFAVAYFSLRE